LTGGHPRRCPLLSAVHERDQGTAERSRGVIQRSEPSRFPGSRAANSTLDAAYGPKALELAGRKTMVDTSDRRSLRRQVGDRHGARGGTSVGAKHDDTKSAWPPRYVGSDLAHQRNQVRWFGGMVAITWPTSWTATETDSNMVSRVTDYIKGRKGYAKKTTTATTERPGNPDAEFVPTRSSIDSVCLVPSNNIVNASPKLGELGVDHVRALSHARTTLTTR